MSEFKRRFPATAGEVNVQLAELEGHFTFDKHRLGETPVTVADFGNLITDAGLKGYLSSPSFQPATRQIHRCDVGSSSVPPAPDQTALFARLASQSSPTPSVTYLDDPFRVVLSYVYPFGEGAAAGNISEVAVGPGTGAPWAISCRALVRDAEGNPTSIPVAEDEFLTVTYTLTIYVDMADKPFTLNLISGVHDCVLRPFSTRTFNAATAFVQGLQPARISASACSPNGLVDPSANNFSPPTASLTWESRGGTEPGVGNFVDWSYRLAPAQGNTYPEGIGVLSLGLDSWVKYQVSFSPRLPKTNLRTFTLRFRFSIGRR